MVVFHQCSLNSPSERAKCVGRCQHERYWQLGPTTTETGGFHKSPAFTVPYIKRYLDKYVYRYRSRLTRARAFQLRMRCDRNLMSYECCTKAELWNFITNRKIDIPFPSNGKRPSKDQLIEGLERADDNATFTRFGDLAAENRQNIYEKVCESIPDLGLPNIGPHPICQSSSAVRAESRPIFYKQGTYELNINITEGQGQRANRSDVIITNPPALLARMADQDFGLIRRVYINITCGYFRDGQPSIRFGFDLTGGSLHWDDGCPPGWIKGGNASWWAVTIDVSSMHQSRVAQQEGQLKAVVKQISVRAGSRRLRKTDLEDIRQALMRDIGIQD